MRFPNVVRVSLGCVVGTFVAASARAGTFSVARGATVAPLVIEAQEEKVVHLAGDMLADDLREVTGHRPELTAELPKSKSIILAGTLGESRLIAQLIQNHKVSGLEPLKGKWEGTVIQTVERPFPGVDRALVIVGSDRRGTAYGLLQISRQIGVSPWRWWGDVAPAHRDRINLSYPKPTLDSPSVKYRGIFINDEDWGLHGWAKRNYEPETGCIGPKTYRRVFELMLRLRLNYLWPAMHTCTRPFHDIPENVQLADDYGIVAGASHCEAMLYNNAGWDVSKGGRWNYTTNKDRIYGAWETSARTRGDKEAVWTLGIRGIHDQGMEGPPDTTTRIKIVSQVFQDQRTLLDQYVTKQWGPVAQCFVPYKEVLPLYDAGLQVPDDVTLVWVDDNFGYLRRLSNPTEQTRTGGAGVYWHLSYYGGPHSYTWLNTTAPALIWEEFQKAWANQARTMWVINVGDIKPMEVGVDAFARLAWNPEQYGPDAQPQILRQFAREQFGGSVSTWVSQVLTEFYRLGTIRKPELMNRDWAMSLSNTDAQALARSYTRLAAQVIDLKKKIPAEKQDAYFELVEFPARVLAASGQIFLADRNVQLGNGSAEETAKLDGSRKELDQLVEQFNLATAGGKWRGIMSGTVTARDLTAWNSQVRWPWGERAPSKARPATDAITWRSAASANRRATDWVSVPGLGPSATAVSLSRRSGDSWPVGAADAPRLDYHFSVGNPVRELWLDFLPTFRLYPGRQLRVTISIDGGPAQVVEVPGSGGKEDENGSIRSDGVQNNFVRAKVVLPSLKNGRHTLIIQAVDPGVVIDQIGFRG